ncbi:MAG: ankyrin repeat domain-containing protein [Micropepsaceae bacterium]
MRKSCLLILMSFFASLPATAAPTLQEALCTAAKSGTPADVAAALSKGAKVNGRCLNAGSSNALGSALTTAKVDNVRALIKAGANVVGNKDHMPLGYVRNAASAELLLQHGAKVNMVDQYNSTALMHVTSSLASNFDDFYQMNENDAVEIAKVLLAHGASVKHKDEYGGTALMEAAFACLPNLVGLLIDHGADVNAKSSGQTPLARLENIKDMHPVECGATEQVLLAHGATK